MSPPVIALCRKGGAPVAGNTQPRRTVSISSILLFLCELCVLCVKCVCAFFVYSQLRTRPPRCSSTAFSCVVPSFRTLYRGRFNRRPFTTPVVCLLELLMETHHAQP